MSEKPTLCNDDQCFDRHKVLCQLFDIIFKLRDNSPIKNIYIRMGSDTGIYKIHENAVVAILILIVSLGIPYAQRDNTNGIESRFKYINNDIIKKLRNKISVSYICGRTHILNRSRLHNDVVTLYLKRGDECRNEQVTYSPIFENIDFFGKLHEFTKIIGTTSELDKQMHLYKIMHTDKMVHYGHHQMYGWQFFNRRLSYVNAPNSLKKIKDIDDSYEDTKNIIAITEEKAQNDYNKILESFAILFDYDKTNPKNTELQFWRILDKVFDASPKDLSIILNKLERCTPKVKKCDCILLDFSKIINNNILPNRVNTIYPLEQ